LGQTLFVLCFYYSGPVVISRRLDVVVRRWVRWG
jgi:hypothetical protein